MSFRQTFAVSFCLIIVLMQFCIVQLPMLSAQESLNTNNPATPDELFKKRILPIEKTFELHRMPSQWR